MNKRDYKNLVICVSTVAIWLMVLFFCVYRPYKQNMEGIQNQLQENSVAINTVRTFFAEHGEKNTYQNKLAVNLKLLKEKIPSELAEAEFLAKVNEIAMLSNVQIIEMKPSEYKNDKKKINEHLENEIKAKEDYSSKCWIITLHGDYFNIVKFLRQINSLPRLVNIMSGEVYSENEYLVCKLALQIYLANYNK